MSYNPFIAYSTSQLTAPAYKLVEVTASDTVDLPGGVARGLLVGSAGAATIIDASGATCTLIPLQVGYNPIGCTRVKAAGLTASDIWAIY
jgi:hypothetical protein